MLYYVYLETSFPIERNVENVEIMNQQEELNEYLDLKSMTTKIENEESDYDGHTSSCDVLEDESQEDIIECS